MIFGQRIKKLFNLSETKVIIIQNLFWSVVGKCVSLVSGLILGILVARYLGPSQYGLMSYVISYVTLFQTFSIFGLDSIEIREEAKSNVPYTTIIGTAFGLKIFFGCIFILAVIITSLIFEANKITITLIVIYSFSIIFNSFSVIRNYFTSIVENKYIVKAEITRTLIGAGVKIVLLLLNAALVWFIVASLFDTIILATGYITAYRKKIGRIKEWTFNLSYSKFLVKESFPLMLTSVAVMLYQRIDQVMIGNIIDKESVGYFSVASRFVEVLIYVPMMLAHTITPVLVKAHERSISEYSKKGQQFMEFSLWLSLILSAVVSLLSYPIVLFTFGKAYLPAVAVLQVMSFKTASVALSNTAGAMLISENLQRYAIFRDLPGCLVCIGLNLILLPRYGIVAAAYITIIANVVAGYLADAFIPAYRHLFKRQTRAIIFGWKNVFSIKKCFAKT